MTQKSFPLIPRKGGGHYVNVERQQLEGEWKGIRKTLKCCNDKKMQSEVYEKLDEESHR